MIIPNIRPTLLGIAIAVVIEVAVDAFVTPVPWFAIAASVFGSLLIDVVARRMVYGHFKFTC